MRPFGSRPARWRRLQTIRFRLAAALAVALLPVLALSILQAAQTYRREAEYQRRDLVRSAQISAGTARARIDSAVVMLETLRPESVGLYCEQRLQRLAQRTEGFSALLRYSRTGRLVCASHPTTFTRLNDSTTWFTRLRGGEAVAVGRAPAGVFGPRPTLLTAVRAEQPQGVFDGVFVAALDLDSLRPAARDPALPAAAEVAIVDATGALLTATDVGAFRGVPRNWTALPAARRSSLFYGKDALGRNRVYAGAPLVGQDVYVLLAAPTQEVFSWARVNPMAALVTPLLAWLLALAAVMVVSERVVIRWLGYLDRIAGIYAKGRFTVRPVQARNAPLEIRALAHTLDQMADAIDARDLRLRESLAHKDALMREIHHRVKNNLQVISSLLNMQQRSLTDPAARAAMSDTRQRITALALIYRALYQSPDLRRADVRQFLEELIAQLISGEVGRGPLVRTELDVDDLIIDPDKLAPLALWAVEAITNAQKHAFDGRGGSLRVRFKVGKEWTTLEVEDDGPGPDESSESAKGVGRTLMTAFARQLRGTSEITTGAAGGMVATLHFPTPEPAEAPTGDPGNPVAA